MSPSPTRSSSRATPVPTQTNPTGQGSDAPSVTATPRVTELPVITYAEVVDGALEVAGYMPGFIADGDSCTFELAVGGQTVRQTTLSVANVRVSSCPTARFTLTPGYTTLVVRLVWQPTGATSQPVTIPTTR